MAMSSSKDESDGKEKQSQSSLSLIAALKDGNYVLAEEMIQDPVHGSRYLDEDARGGVKPLAMVMFGVLPGELIHLYLAKLMVEHGVDVNYRIREFGYISRFSCFEQLIDLILDVNRDLKRQNFDVPHMIGMNNQPVKSWTEARLHLIKLLKVFLEFRGNPNFRSRILGCTLFHKILRSSNPDVDVIRILHHAGGDINKVPIFGFPPIVSMANNSFFDSDLQIVKEIWKPTQYKTYHHTFSGSNLVRRITTVANSALMVSMHTGSTETAIFFLKQGAQFDTVGIYNTNVGARYTISCLFLPLLHLSLSYFKYFAAVSLNTNEKYLKDDVFMRNHLEYDEKNCNKSLMCKVVKSSLSPIVDYIVEHSLSSEEDISRDDISEQDINSLIIRYSSYSSGIFCHQFSFTYLLSALFGQSTATLQQLCVRKIFDSIFFTKPTLDTQKLIHRLKYSDFSDFSFLAELFIPDVKFMVNNITDVVIKNLVNCLQLPPKLSILFHLEAARLQICLNLSAYECLDAFCDVPSRSPSRVSSLSDNLFTFNINESRTETDSDSGESFDDSDIDCESSEWDSSSDSSPSDDSSSSSHPMSGGSSFVFIHDDNSDCDKHLNHSDTHCNDQHVINNEINDEYDDRDKSINKNDYDCSKSISHNYNDTVNDNSNDTVNSNGEDDLDKNCLHDYNELSESLSLSSVDSNGLSLG